MKKQVLTVEAVKWRLRHSKNNADQHFAFGYKITGVFGEMMRLLRKYDMKCQFPECGRTVGHFEIHGSNGKLIPMCRTEDGRYIPMTIDHIKAQCLGGKNNIENKWIMCYECNQKKACIEGDLYNIINGKRPGHYFNHKENNNG